MGEKNRKRGGDGCKKNRERERRRKRKNVRPVFQLVNVSNSY